MDTATFLSKNITDVYFLMKYCLMGDATLSAEYKSDYVSLGKTFFELLSRGNVTEEEFATFNQQKSEVMDSVFQVHHEFSEDDFKLNLEKQLLEWEYGQVQKLAKDNTSPAQINIVSEKDFFNESV